MLSQLEPDEENRCECTVTLTLDDFNETNINSSDSSLNDDSEKGNDNKMTNKIMMSSPQSHLELIRQNINIRAEQMIHMIESNREWCLRAAEDAAIFNNNNNNNKHDKDQHHHKEQKAIEEQNIIFLSESSKKTNRNVTDVFGHVLHSIKIVCVDQSTPCQINSIKIYSSLPNDNTTVTDVETVNTDNITSSKCRILIADEAHCRVKVYDFEFNLILQFGERTLNVPKDVAMLRDGRFVVVGDAGFIKVFSPTGILENSVDISFGHRKQVKGMRGHIFPKAIGVTRDEGDDHGDDDEDIVCVSDLFLTVCRGKLFTLAETMEFIKMVMCCDQYGDLIVIQDELESNQTIDILHRNGEVVYRAVTGVLENPSAICTDSEKNILVADSGNSHIFCLKASEDGDTTLGNNSDLRYLLKLDFEPKSIALCEHEDIDTGYINKDLFIADGSDIIYKHHLNL